MALEGEDTVGDGVEDTQAEEEAVEVDDPGKNGEVVKVKS